jgi:hypothetical protein
MTITGVINYKHNNNYTSKFTLDDIDDPKVAWNFFYEWKDSYNVYIIPDTTQLVMYTPEYLSKVAVTFDVSSQGFSDFLKFISYDTYAQEYRNPLHEEYKDHVWGKLKQESKFTFSSYPTSLESTCIRYIQNHFEELCLVSDRLKLCQNTHDSIYNNFTIQQMCEMTNGEEWTSRYSEALEVSGFLYCYNRFVQLHNVGVGIVKLEDVLISDVIESARNPLSQDRIKFY